MYYGIECSECVPGATSAVTRILGENAGSLGQLGAAEIGLIASGSLFGAMASSTLLIGIGDKNIGRKLELNLAAKNLKSTLDHDF